MQTVLLIIQIVISVILVILILIQPKGTGLAKSSSMMGGSTFTKRGLEKLIFRLTFVLVTLFIIFSLAQIIL